MKESLHSEVRVSYLSPEELMKYRIGSKCDLIYRHKKGRDWKWRSEKARKSSLGRNVYE